MTKDLIVIPSTCIINIRGRQYSISSKPPIVGDMVIDRKDGLYGVCDMMMQEDTIAIRDGFVVELGVPISSVYTLVLFDPINN